MSRLVAKHHTLKEIQKWSTKQIVLFGRWFGYTPASVFRLQDPIKTENNNQNIREIVKSEIMRENLQNNAISFNTNLVEWIEGIEASETKCLSVLADEKFIIVDNVIEECENFTSPHPLYSNNCLQFPIENGSNEIRWINELCRKMQVRFEQEEIVDGEIVF